MLKSFCLATTLTLVANLPAQAQLADMGRFFHSDPCAQNAQPVEWMPYNNEKMSPHMDTKVHVVELTMPENPRFRESMGGMPVNFSLDSFHAAEGMMKIVEHPMKEGMKRTDITFIFKHLFPLGVYSLWDVTTSLDFDSDDEMIFADRPLMNEEDMIWLSDDRASEDAVSDRLYGGVKAMGVNTFRADQCGNARITVYLDHRPGVEFLLDYHANDFSKGGMKGKDIFPGTLWGKFPQWDQ